MLALHKKEVLNHGEQELQEYQGCPERTEHAEQHAGYPEHQKHEEHQGCQKLPLTQRHHGGLREYLRLPHFFGGLHLYIEIPALQRKKAASPEKSLRPFNGVPEGIRTPDPTLRSHDYNLYVVNCSPSRLS